MKIEYIVIAGGVIVFLAIVGTMYLFVDKKAPSSFYQESKSDISPTGLAIAGDKKLLFKGPPNSSDSQKKEVEPVKKTMPPMSINKSKKYKATMSTSMGDIVITLEAAKTPLTVNNFVSLARAGFYNNTVFHRVIKDFMIQGGDPQGDGTGGPGYTVPAEFDASLKHVRGAIATARLSDGVNPKKESSGSQFFIVHKDTPQLDGQYTVFGMVTSGLDVVDKIATSEVEMSRSGEPSKPVSPIKITAVAISEE